jgi:hypothetical protein
MCEDKEDNINILTDSILAVIGEELTQNKLGYDAIKSVYWFGRLSDSSDLNKKVKEVIRRHLNKLEGDYHE